MNCYYNERTDNMGYDFDYNVNETYEIYILDIATGSKEALEILYNKTKSYVYGYAFSMLNNVTDAEDVMQDTYVNIYKYAYMYNPRNKPLAWILKITKNLCLNKLKKRNRKETDIADIEHKITNSKKNEHHDYVFAKAILEDLSEEEKKIVILSSVDGLKYREIADLLDLNLSTVLSKYHRAMNKLRAKYKEA